MCFYIIPTYATFVIETDMSNPSLSLNILLLLWQCQLNFAIGNEKSFYLIYTQRITKNVNCYSIDRLDRLGSSSYVSRYHFSFERILLHYYKMIQTQAKSTNVDCSVHTTSLLINKRFALNLML